MLRIDSKNMNFNGVSVINDQSFVSFNASVNEPDNTGYISINLNNIAQVRENLAATKIDLAAFLEEVLNVPAAEEEE